MSENSGISLEYFVLNSTNWTNGSPWRRGRPGKVSVKMCAGTVQNLIGIAVKTGIFHDIIPRYFQTAKLCDVHTKCKYANNRLLCKKIMTKVPVPIMTDLYRFILRCL
jgi:hypothetical protein